MPFKLRMEQKEQSTSEKYPHLYDELNDATSNVPAYVRFQNNENSFLRQDLKKLKADHFKKNYAKHLNLPAEDLVSTQFEHKNLDANKYFQLKYFLTENQKQEEYSKYVDKIHHHWKVASGQLDSQAKKRHEKNFGLVKEFGKQDIKLNEGQDQDQIDKNYMGKSNDLLK